MFRFHKTLDIVTLFHKASSPASVRAASVLKQASASATEASNEDRPGRATFEFNITEEAPTTDQLETILNYVGPSKISSVVKGATTEKEALRKFKESTENFRQPVIVDWNNGKAIASDNESEILKMLGKLNGK